MIVPSCHVSGGTPAVEDIRNGGHSVSRFHVTQALSGMRTWEKDELSSNPSLGDSGQGGESLTCEPGQFLWVTEGCWKDVWSQPVVVPVAASLNGHSQLLPFDAQETAGYVFSFAKNCGKTHGA